MSGLCPDDRLQAVVALASGSDNAALAEAEVLLAQFGGDPRLHFLKGSLLAASGNYEAAQTSMRDAVDIAPDFVLARYQLGFLLLSSGKAHAAQEAWGPLHGLPKDHYLKLFVTGLTHLIHDQFADARGWLEQGIAANVENPPMNNDIRLILAEIATKGDGGDQDAETSSSVHQLLQQSALKATRH